MKFFGCPIRFLVSWIWPHGVLNLVPGEGFWLPGFNSWLPGLGSMVSWIQFLVARTLYYGCLVKVPGGLDLLPGELDLVSWLPGEGCRLHGFNYWFPGLGSMVAW